MEYQKIAKVSKNTETVTNENDKEIPKETSEERYIYIQKKDKKLLIILIILILI